MELKAQIEDTETKLKSEKQETESFKGAIEQQKTELQNLQVIIVGRKNYVCFKLITFKGFMC